MSNSAPKLKEVKAEEAAVPPAAGSKKKKIIIAILILVLLGIAAGAAAFYFGGNAASGAEGKKKVEKSVPAVFLPLENFTVNLQSENGDKYLQAAITLQLLNDEQVGFYKENMPQVRSRIILILSSKSADELLTNEGKLKLTDEITSQLQKPFNKDEVAPKEGRRLLGVFFTSFMIQ